MVKYIIGVVLTGHITLIMAVIADNIFPEPTNLSRASHIVAMVGMFIMGCIFGLSLCQSNKETKNPEVINTTKGNP